MMKLLQLLLIIALSGRPAMPQEITAPELTADQRQAADTITEGRVLGTVSFLASDELAGRDTPSKELTIAASYVASRFRGAGLEAPGGDGSYYQEHDIVTLQPPQERPVLVNGAGQEIVPLGMLSGGPTAIDVTGTITDEATAQSEASAKIVLVDEPDLPAQTSDNPRRVLATVTRRLRRFSEGLPDVVLIACDDDSILPQTAGQLQQHAMAHRDGQVPDCAVVLVAADSVIVGTELTARVGAQRENHEPVRNVVGILKGSDPELADEAVLVSAHLDHIGLVTWGQDRINNGADDNATGVTAVLSMADAFSRLTVRPRRSIVFVTFWGEEKGLKGSKQFVKDPLWPLNKIVANINIEMVGRPEQDAREKAWMTGWSHSSLGPMMNAGSQRMGVEIFNRTDVGEMLYSRSDNHSFVRQGVIAHSFSAGSLHADYHQPSDEWQKLDIPHMTKVIRGLYAGTLFVANSPETPQAN